MNRTDLAWAAGFLEAEGCFSASKVNSVVTISQVDLEPLDVFYNTVQIGTLKGPYEKATASIDRRPQWIWYAYGVNARAVYRLVRPWLGEYREAQAQRALGPTTELPERVPFVRWPRAEKIAWCGGFFEGEGCFSRSSAGLTARLANTDLELVERTYATVGTGHLYGPYDRPEKQQWLVTTSGFEEMQAILAMLWPWLSSRRRITAMTLLSDYLAFHPCGHRRATDGSWRRHCPRCFRPGPRTGELAQLRRGARAVEGKGEAVHRIQTTGALFLPRAVRHALRLRGGETLRFRMSGTSTIVVERLKSQLRSQRGASARVTSRGLVVIPAAVRREAALRPRDFVRLSVKGRRLVLERVDAPRRWSASGARSRRGSPLRRSL